MAHLLAWIRPVNSYGIRSQAMGSTTTFIAIKWNGRQVWELFSPFFSSIVQAIKSQFEIIKQIEKKKIDKILFSVDDVETGTIKAATGFWSRSSFDTIAPGIANPWRSSTTNMAPFDQEFYLIMNLAIGGNVIFPDDATNAPG